MTAKKPASFICPICESKDGLYDPETGELIGCADCFYRSWMQLDEDQIVKEMEGHVIDKYFYEYQQGGKQIVVSWAGIKQIVRKVEEQGQTLSIVDREILNENTQYTVIVTAENLKTKARRMGACVQPKMMRLKDGREVDDPFALPKALSKAQRNALRIFLPEAVIEKAYKEWKKSKSIEFPSIWSRPESPLSGVWRQDNG